MSTNAANWFEIPAKDFDRAVKFYGTVFDEKLTRLEFEERSLALFPPGATPDNAGGSILKVANFEPSRNGTVVYLDAGDNMDPILERIPQAGGSIDMPKTEIGHGYLATFVDSEGNVVGLHGMG